MIIVFYDGACGLCSKEIKYYQRIAPHGIFQWFNIADSLEELKDFKISEVNALKQLHVVDEDGILHIGLDAFIVIWSNLRYWKIAAFLVSLWPIRPTLSILYNKFATWRFANLYCEK
ncbi:thiol-disulfide oxidoreductase DCC family protein [Curvivirga aplysinae]|uniref:thiol-disulfide oxidoreductase DCC family protein n=1 Tax=Curvivirga aplysinae TaxID=2529852 RepID=UPI0012BBE5F5|nr:DUF393 domain-containing protein [Curvivirga aplysinae]MTI08992.1 DUF393 domain-containing protein [Curvivirga aplysinae]